LLRLAFKKIQEAGLKASATLKNSENSESE
jgi:hypothetical protein